MLSRRVKTNKPKEVSVEDLDLMRLPQHLAVIMDGNGRWARGKNLPRAAGHRAGVESLRVLVETCAELGISILTVYAFSTENWKRPAEEVSVLMNLMVEYLRGELNELNKNNIRINPIGYLDSLPEEAKRELALAKKQTAGNDKLLLNVALNYGGRAEIVDAVRTLCRQSAAGEINPEAVSEETVNNTLYTAGIPDPDLLIRPSGELRVSNFLLWQLAYSEFWFTNVYWPDFRQRHLYQALYDYQNRERRFGGLKD